MCARVWYAAVYTDTGSTGCRDAEGKIWPGFFRVSFTGAACKDYCDREPDCMAYMSRGFLKYCTVFGFGLSQPSVGTWNAFGARALASTARCLVKDASATGRFATRAAHPLLLHGHTCSNSPMSCPPRA